MHGVARGRTVSVHQSTESIEPGKDHAVAFVSFIRAADLLVEPLIKAAPFECAGDRIAQSLRLNFFKLLVQRTGKGL